MSDRDAAAAAAEKENHSLALEHAIILFKATIGIC